MITQELIQLLSTVDPQKRIILARYDNDKYFAIDQDIQGIQEYKIDEEPVVAIMYNLATEEAVS